MNPGKTAVIVGAQWGDEGKGKIVDPFAFMKEVDALRATGVRVDGNLFVSNRAHVILPYHRMI